MKPKHSQQILQLCSELKARTDEVAGNIQALYGQSGLMLCEATQTLMSLYQVAAMGIAVKDPEVACKFHSAAQEITAKNIIALTEYATSSHEPLSQKVAEEIIEIAIKDSMHRIKALISMFSTIERQEPEGDE